MIFTTFTQCDHDEPQKCLSFPWLAAPFFPKGVAMHNPGTFSTLLHSYNFLLQGLTSIETRAQRSLPYISILTLNEKKSTLKYNTTVGTDIITRETTAGSKPQPQFIV